MLEVGGHLTSLRRTRVGGFGIDRARSLEQLGQTFEMLDLDAAARATFPVFELSAGQATDVRFGRALTSTTLGHAGPVALFDGPEFLALYDQHGADARAVAVFVG